MPNREELTAAGLDPDAYVALDRDWYDGSIRAMDARSKGGGAAARAGQIVGVRGGGPDGLAGRRRPAPRAPA